MVGIYDPWRDELAIDRANRDLTGFTKNNDRMNESGAFIYAKNASFKQMPFEAYAIYKRESSYKPTTNSTVQSLDLGTVGFRIMPQFTDGLSGNLEAALQCGSRGDQDVLACMVDSDLSYKIPLAESMKPVVDCGLYYLSGDDPSTSKDEGWNPLWARYPQYSELYVYAYDADAAGRWSNIMLPHAGLAVSPVSWLKTTAFLGYLWAPEANGPGAGRTRGVLGALKNEFAFGEKLLLPKDKLTGHLWLELLEPGDYYKVDDLAVFARWEVAYAF